MCCKVLFDLRKWFEVIFSRILGSSVIFSRENRIFKSSSICVESIRCVNKYFIVTHVCWLLIHSLFGLNPNWGNLAMKYTLIIYLKQRVYDFYLCFDLFERKQVYVLIVLLSLFIWYLSGESSECEALNRDEREFWYMTQWHMIHNFV